MHSCIKGACDWARGGAAHFSGSWVEISAVLVALTQKTLEYNEKWSAVGEMVIGVFAEVPHWAVILALVKWRKLQHTVKKRTATPSMPTAFMHNSSGFNPHLSALSIALAFIFLFPIFPATKHVLPYFSVLRSHEDRHGMRTTAEKEEWCISVSVLNSTQLLLIAYCNSSALKTEID